MVLQSDAVHILNIKLHFFFFIVFFHFFSLLTLKLTLSAKCVHCWMLKKMIFCEQIFFSILMYLTTQKAWKTSHSTVPVQPDQWTNLHWDCHVHKIVIQFISLFIACCLHLQRNVKRFHIEWQCCCKKSHPKHDLNIWDNGGCKVTFYRPCGVVGNWWKTGNGRVSLQQSNSAELDGVWVAHDDVGKVGQLPRVADVDINFKHGRVINQ